MCFEERFNTSNGNEELKNMFDEADIDGDNFLSQDEFPNFYVSALLKYGNKCLLDSDEWDPSGFFNELKDVPLK